MEIPIFDLMSTNDSQNGQRLSKIQSGLLPFEGVCTRESQKVTCDGVVDIEARTVQITGPPRLHRNIVAFLNEADGVRKEVAALLCLEM